MIPLLIYCLSISVASSTILAIIFNEIGGEIDFRIIVITCVTIVFPSLAIFIVGLYNPIISFYLSNFGFLIEEIIKLIAIITVLRFNYSNISAIKVACFLGLVEVVLVKVTIAFLDYENIYIYLNNSLVAYIILSIIPLLMHTCTSFIIGINKGAKRVAAFFGALVIHFIFNETRAFYIDDIPPIIHWHLFLIEIPLYFVFILMLISFATRRSRLQDAVRANAPPIN